MRKPLKGLIASVFTPMKEDGSLNPEMTGPVVAHLKKNKITALYVCGTNGEGPSLTVNERMLTAESYLMAANGKLPVIVQVGHNCLIEAAKLAGHAQKVGAAALSVFPPAYYKIGSVELLLECLMKISSAAPDLPFFYCHIPQTNRVGLDMLELLQKSVYFLPNLAGVIYRGLWTHEYQVCMEFQDGRFSMLFGGDEMLTSGLAAGAEGAVGSTFSFAAPLYTRIISAFKNREVAEARRWQSIAITMVRIFKQFRYQAAVKGAMKLIDLDCGPCRLPLLSLTPEELDSLKRKLGEIGFFQWALK